MGALVAKKKVTRVDFRQLVASKFNRVKPNIYKVLEP
jgi:hypothetical protein